jgi:CubicO group peptidase (beta-lactamase class C family)
MTDSHRPAPAAGRRPARFAAMVVGSLVLAACATNASDADEGATTSAGTTPASSSPADATASTDPGSPTSVAPSTSSTDAATNPTGTTEQRQYDFSAVGPIVDAAISEHGLNGAALVVVHRDDGVVHEQYWGEFGPDRVSLIASSSKVLVAGVLLRLADQGLIDLDAPVADVAEWGSGNPAITPAQLVSNSSGLVGLGPNPAYPPYVCQFLPGGTLQDCAASIFTTPDDDALVIAPDTEFRYGGGQWQVAGAVAEAASGQSWAELIDDTYVEPCGVDSLGFNNHWTQFGLGFDYPTDFAGDPATLVATDNPNLEGGAYITAPDYARLLLMLLRDGRCDDAQVLSSAAVDRMLADRVGELYDGTGYGMGWFVDRSSGRRTGPGAFGSVPWLDLANDHGAFLVIEGAAGVGGGLAGELFAPVADAVADAS